MAETPPYKPQRGSELQQVIRAERTGQPFLVFRDESSTLTVVQITGNRLTLGRSDSNEVVFYWDDQISGVHVEIGRHGSSWVISDGGLSTNGTYIQGERLDGSRRLSDGDAIQIGRTLLQFRLTESTEKTEETLFVEAPLPAPDLSEGQARVLAVLAASRTRDSGLASNAEIAAEIGTSVDAIKAHLRVLFGRFGVKDLPPVRRREALIDEALAHGIVSLPRSTGPGGS